jgi:flavin reductase (DIM6/NTAB) family NADH-FMN oxidoreductase RutF
LDVAVKTRMTITGEEFRRALGHFATGVTVVTVRRNQDLIQTSYTA